MHQDPRLSDMRDHIIRLADAYGIQLTWLNGWRRAESWPELEEAAVPRIRSTADYLVGLHELGHCIDPLARSWHDRHDAYGVIVCEGAAWAWAVEASRFDLSLREWDRAGRCFRSHLAYVRHVRSEETLEAEFLGPLAPGD